MPCLRDVAAACLAEVYPNGSCLFDPELLTDLYHQVASLPSRLTWGGFECRLAEGDRRIDFGISVERAQAKHVVVPESEALCQRMLRNWLALAPSMRASFSRATIEFDRPTEVALDRSAAPSLWGSAFAFFRVALHGGPELSCALSKLLGALRNEPVDPHSSEQIARALPQGSQILHVAALEHRGAREVRLHFAVHSDYLPTLCRALKPSHVETARLLRTLIADLPVGRLAVQVSTREGEFRPHSVEFVVPSGTRALTTWRTLLTRLSAAGVASEEKVDAVLAWPGSRTHVPLGGRIERGFYVALQLAQQPTAKVYPHFHWTGAHTRDKHGLEAAAKHSRQKSERAD